MRIAYLVLVHEQPSHFRRLVNALDSPNIVFYIHLDAKRRKEDFDFFAGKSNVIFLEDRISVNRSGFSQTIAMCKLIEKAIEGNYDYYLFLSGRDYPIKDNNYIYRFLADKKGMNFINFYPLVGDAEWIDNIQTYDFVDAIAWVPPVFKKPVNALRLAIRKILPKREFLPDIVPYRGSTSWCLNHDTVKYIVKYIQSSDAEEFINYFKYVHNSDEIFFQTLVLNSPFASQCRYYESDILMSNSPRKNENNAYLHFIDWDPRRENPAILDESDFYRLKETDKLFARKFDADKSKKLLERIDREIL